MTPEEFRALLDTYGADLTRWPHARRQDAQRLLQDDEDARLAFAEAQEMDALLSTAEPPLSEARRRRLTDAILDNLPDDPGAIQPRRVPEFMTLPHPSAAGIGVLVRPLSGWLAACLAFGIVVGAGICMAQRSLPGHLPDDWTVTLDLYGVK
jgi:hypothetical protein